MSAHFATRFPELERRQLTESELQEHTSTTMAKKKPVTDAAQRNRNLRQRKVDAGKRQLSVWLDGSLIDQIDKLKGDQSRDDIINNAVTSYTQSPKKAPAKKAKKPKGGNCSLCGRHRPDSELKELLRGTSRYTQAQCRDFVACNKARGIVK